MKYKNIISGIFVLIQIIYSQRSNAQSVPEGINYQGIARHSTGNVISNQSISVKVGIYAASISGTMEWEETHALATNQLGLFYFIIGQGITTGSGSLASFSDINWGASAHFIKISIDETGGSSYTAIDTIQFWSVPYAMYSGASATTSQLFRLNQLLDVDTIGVLPGYVLKYNGNLWLPAKDKNSDTALFAYNSNHSIYCDTSKYANKFLGKIDSVYFANQADTAQYAVHSSNSVKSKNSNYCDTATYALNSGSSFLYWNLIGNSGTNPGTNFLGTIDNTDLVFKTNNNERMRITSTGKVGIGITSPAASLHIIGNDGLLETGTFGSGISMVLGAGTRMHWYPKKAAFRVGGATSTQWDDASIGIYSFAAGNNTIGSGAYSTTSGQSTTAGGQYSVAMGYGCTSAGYASIALGSACNANGAYSVSLARGCVANDSGSVCIGYHSNVLGKFATGFGAYCNASGNYSTTMGYYANTNSKTGSFVFADASTATATNSTANNQFMVRASGGVVFYSNPTITMGVTLPAGGGSWASVSDKNKKEHFKSEDANSILNKLSQIEVTSWNYKTQSPSIRHIGPMAQDLYKAFQFGESDTTITTIDIDGINLIAIQALAKKTNELKNKSNEVIELKAMVDKLEKEKKDLEKRVLLIENKLFIKE